MYEKQILRYCNRMIDYSTLPLPTLDDLLRMSELSFDRACTRIEKAAEAGNKDARFLLADIDQVIDTNGTFDLPFPAGVGA